LGRSGLFVPPLGIGTNKWGSNGSSPDRFVQTFRHAVESGLSLFDTAEAYSSGQSERALGAAIAQSAHPVTVITKFAPYPTRWSAKTLLTALDASLARLGVPFVHLYLVHFPFTFLSIESLMDAMSVAHASGKIKAVGVSNYSASQMRRAADRLSTHGIPLAANEVHYSLIHRQPETNGVLDACRECGAALIAYFPLGAGLLNSPEPRERLSFMHRRLLGRPTPEQLDGLLRVLARVAAEHSASVTQVALNWLLQRDDRIIAIPGATRPNHVEHNSRALGWQLTDREFEDIDLAWSRWKKDKRAAD
jgi:aryl-alcohol dehydrogenase-like predicted oxidoreductase